MTNPAKRRTPMAGGIFIAGGMIGGAIIGVFARQPSAGMVIGFIAGIIVATIIWLLDRR